MKQSESSIQKCIVSYLRVNGCITCNCDVMNILGAIGGAKNSAVRQKAIRYAKSMGYTNGQQDLLVITKNRIVLLEIKAEKGRQSPEQKEYERKVKELGVEYYVVRSVEEVTEILR